MSEHPAYTEYHPRWHRTRVSAYWWLKRWTYVVFILRELSSAFIAWAVVYLLLLVREVGRGERAYAEFLRWSAHPVVLTVNVLAFAFAVLHAVTWFNLAPQALTVRLRGQRVPGRLIAASNYAAWVLVSGAAAWLILE